MASGGSSRSAVNLANTWDPYEVLLVRRRGKSRPDKKKLECLVWTRHAHQPKAQGSSGGTVVNRKEVCEAATAAVPAGVKAGTLYELPFLSWV